MSQIELNIDIPSGYKIDLEHSTKDKVVLVKDTNTRSITYQNIAAELFLRKLTYFINKEGSISITHPSDIGMADENNAKTVEQLEWILALNKLQNVAVYLNKGWHPNWNDETQDKWTIMYNAATNEMRYIKSGNLYKVGVYFKSAELAEEAVNILGEHTIKLALGWFKNC